MIERRRTLRVHVEAGRLSVHVQTDDHAASGAVLNASSGGLLVSFPRKEVPLAAVGTRWPVHIVSDELDAAIEAEVRVCHRADRDGEVHYGFELLDPDAVAALLPHELRAVFNRRSEFRRAPPSKSDVRVVLSAYGGLGHHRCDSVLLDLSESGMALRVERNDEYVFATSAYVTAAIRLPGRELALTVECAVRNRNLDGDRVRYGLEFSARRTANWAEVSEVLASYLAR